MRMALITILVWVWPLPVLSDILSIDVQEEADMSRLVMPLPRASNWTANVVGNQLSLTIESATGFDAATMSLNYRRLSDVRIGASPSTLLINITCSCDTRTYQIGQSFLMVEVRDKSPLIQTETTLSPFLTYDWQRPSNPQDNAPDNQPPAQTTSGLLDKTFALGLSRGAYDGFLTLSDQIETNNQTPSNLSLGQDLPIGITASLDTIRNADIALAPRFDCDFATTKIREGWKFSKPFNLELGQAHNQIATALPTAENAVWLDLALLMVGYGLGTEASVILDDLGQDDDVSKLLHFMSQVLEGNETTEPEGIDACGETLAIWRFLNNPQSVASPQDARLMMAYKLLSPTLQRRFMYDFSIALTETGNLGLQSELMSYRETIAQTKNIDDNEDGDAVAPNLEGPRKLLREDLSRTDINSLAKTHISTSQLSLGELETLWVEQRSQPNGPTILRQLLDRYLATENYVAILDLLETSQRAMDQDSHTEIVDDYLSASIAAMRDADIIAFAYRNTSLPIPDTVTNAIQRRLQDMGMASFLEGVPPAPASREEAIAPTPEENFAFSIPISTSLPASGTPSVAEAEEIMARSAEIRRKVQDFINVNDAR